MKVDYRKIYSQIRRDSGNRIATDIREQKKRENYKPVDKRDKEIYDKGFEWFNSGLSLDEAPVDIKDNTNFVNGFEKAKRLSDINNMIYNDGKVFYLNGGILDNVSDKMKNNEYFVKGYMDAKNLENNRNK